MQRRDFVMLIGGAATTPLLRRHARGASGRPLIAILNLNSASSVSPRVRGFLQAMRELGHVEGRDFDLAERYADGQLERLPIIADELARLKPDLFVVGSMPAAFAAKQASKTSPIVGVNLVDPVGLGLAATEARPGGQVTGSLTTIEGLPGKQLALAIEVIPGTTSFGLLVNPGNPGHAFQLRDAEAAAAMLGRKLALAEAAAPKDIDRAFEALARERADLILVLADPVFIRENRRIAVLAAAK